MFKLGQIKQPPFSRIRRARRVWARTLRELPLEVIVSNDRRVAFVDFYYGNSGNPTARVVMLLNDNGNEITSYSLEEVANLTKVLETTSTAHWCKDTHLSEDGRFVLIDTMIAKRDPKTCMHVNSAEEADECSKSVPYEQLKIDMTTGRLVERLKLTER